MLPEMDAGDAAVVRAACSAIRAEAEHRHRETSGAITRYMQLQKRFQRLLSADRGNGSVVCGNGDHINPEYNSVSVVTAGASGSSSSLATWQGYLTD